MGVKKFKFIASLSAIVLSLSLLIVGVYAATSASLSITSRISFDVSDVFVDITYGKDSEAITIKNYVEAPNGSKSNSRDIDDVALSNTAFSDIGDTVTYYVTVKNVSSESISLTLSATYTITSGSNSAVGVTKTGECENFTLAYNAEKTISVEVELLNSDNVLESGLVINVGAVKS